MSYCYAVFTESFNIEYSLSNTNKFSYSLLLAIKPNCSSLNIIKHVMLTLIWWFVNVAEDKGMSARDKRLLKTIQPRYNIAVIYLRQTRWLCAVNHASLTCCSYVVLHHEKLETLFKTVWKHTLQLIYFMILWPVMYGCKYSASLSG